MAGKKKDIPKQKVQDAPSELVEPPKLFPNVTVINALCEGIDSTSLLATAPQF